MENIEIGNIRIEKSEQQIKGALRPVARAYKATPKAKYFKEKLLWGHYYASPEAREEAINKYVARLQEIAKEEENEKQKKADFRANLVNPFKVGDLVYDSWGYKQTNLDFYEVVEIGKKSVVIRPIAQKYIRGTGFMSEQVSADKGNFIGEPIKRILSVDSAGKAHIPAPRRGWLSPTTEKEEHYQSHYA